MLTSSFLVIKFSQNILVLTLFSTVFQIGSPPQNRLWKLVGFPGPNVALKTGSVKRLATIP